MNNIIHILTYKIHMKNLLILIFILAFMPTFSQIITAPTPKQYAVNSGVPFFEAEYQMHRYWYVIHFESGATIYCHKLRCQNNGDDYEAVFVVTEMPTGKIIEKSIFYKNEVVKYTSVLR